MQWLPLLWTLAVKGTAILCVGWLAAWCLRGGSAAIRHLVWTATFAALLALPVLSVALPAVFVPASSLPGSGMLFAVTAQSKAAPAVPAGKPGLAKAAPASPSPAPAPFDWRTWAVRLWLAGVALLVFQTVTAHAALWRLRLRARLLPEDSTAAAPVYEAPAGSMPIATGLWRPVVFLPADAAEWSAECRQIVLRHELAHIERGDLATQFLARLAVTLHWWNPLVWATWRQFVADRERAADDLVLISGTRASDYAGHLLEVARSMNSTAPLAWAAVAMARKSQLEGRLLDILDARRNRGTSTPKAALGAVIAAVILIAPFAAVRAQSVEQTVNPGEIEAVLRAAASQRNHEMLEQAASAYQKLQKYETAQRLLESALAIRGETAGRQSHSYAAGLVKLGDLEIKAGKPADGEALFNQAIALGDTPEVLPALLYFGMRAYAKNDNQRAAEFFQRALTAEPRGPTAGKATTWLANTRARDAAASVEAENLYLQAMSLQDPSTADYAMTLDFYAFFLKTQARNNEAEATQVRARDIRRAALAADQSQLGAAAVERLIPGTTPPAVVSKSEPEYSAEARAARYQGTVLVKVDVDTDGQAKNIHVLRSLGLGLDEKAIESIRGWRFRPALDAQGQPIAVGATIEVNFRLM